MKNLINKLILLFVAYTCINSQILAQSNPIYQADSMLRDLLSPLCRDTSVAPYFLYDMAVHSLDSIYFTDNNPDTINRDIWYSIYDELRASAYDTTIIDPRDTVYVHGLQWQSDTVIMNILVYNTYRLNDTMINPDYFDIDTVNNTITELYPCEVNPYLLQRVYATSPLAYNLPSQQFTYRIDPNFIFYDKWNKFQDSNWTLQIDFGDGTGWHTYAPGSLSSVSFYSASYSTPGIVYIKSRVLDANTNSIMTSIAEANVSQGFNQNPDSYIFVPGIIAGVYGPCSESGEPLKKVIIYAEGIDLGDIHPATDRNVQRIYEEMISGPELDKLRNFGYTFVVVDWVNSRQDIALNALCLEKLIDTLKCLQLTTSDEGTHEQFVVIGESMGGLVARYALCEMEQESNNGNLGGCLPEKIHNTRLLMTFDSPNAGANIPLAYQHVYRDAGTFLFGANTITQATAGGMSNLLLDSKSAKQMLLYHVDTKIGGSYSEHPDKTAFDAALAGLGNYPQYCKIFAMANGSMQGHGQTRVYDTAQRVPNDYLLDYGSDLYMRAFANNFKILGTNFELHTTPNGSGTIAKINRDFYAPVIKIQLTKKYRWPWPPKIHFKFSITSHYVSSIGITHSGTNMKPYDVIPGSVTDMNQILIKKHTNSSPSFISSSLFFGLKDPNYDTNTHTWSLKNDGYVGNFGSSLSASLYTDGMHYCFIPTFSALDYSLPSNDYWHNITNNSANTNVNRTPFDVITGQIREYPLSFPYYWNEEHLGERNDDLGSWLNGSRSNMSVISYDTCADINFHQAIHFLNREIGDDSLLVENRTTNWTCIYDAEKYIGINQRSLYYAYPTATGSPYIINGIYSKENSYAIANGITHFMAGNSSIVGPHFSILSPGLSSTSYDTADIDWTRCCFISASKHSNSLIRGVSENNKFVLYPNPVINNELIFAFSGQKDELSQLLIYDVMGRKIVDSHFIVPQNISEFKYRFSFSNQPLHGTYFVVIKNGNQIFKGKFIVE